MRLPATVVLVVVVAIAAAGGAGAGRGASDSIVLDWYDFTASAVAAAASAPSGPQTEQVSQDRIWAVSWLAAARAASSHLDPRFADAAVATALHDTLVALVPSRAAAADALLASSLDRIRDGREKDRGVAAGHENASSTLTERNGDGLDTASVDIAWTPPAPSPGVYQLTGGPAVRAGLPNAKLFILGEKNRFDPGPPPALGSKVYLADLAEVHALGGANSTQRTAAQSAVARFWAQASVLTYTQIVRQTLAGDPRPTADLARLVAAFHVIEIDQQIALHTAKYAYLFWRPVTAITTGSVDPDPSWKPYISTPRHPEYPSGHAAYGGTAEVVLAALAPEQRHATFSASSATDGGATRSWVGWQAITDETIDARVWEGVHFRHSDEVGADLGRDVARYDLARLDAIGL